MPAFNRRFDQKKVAGIPLVTIVGLVSMLISGVLFLMTPVILKILLGIIFLFSFSLVIFVFFMGEDLPFRGIYFANLRESDLTTPEHRTKL